MSDLTGETYGVVFGRYWSGETGRLIARLGGIDAQLLGLYLTSNEDASMFGLYELPLTNILVALPALELPRVATAFDALAKAQFAIYDTDTEFVWVPEMARVRLGLRRREDQLTQGDKRIIAANRYYRRVRDNPFLGAFYHRYAKTLHLQSGRRSRLRVIPFPKGLRSPLGAPLKPSTTSTTSTSKYNRKQVQPALTRRDLDPVENSAENFPDEVEHEANLLATALRDSEGPPPRGPDAERRGMGGADQGPHHRAGEHLPADPRLVHESDASRRDAVPAQLLDARAHLGDGDGALAELCPADGGGGLTPTPGEALLQRTIDTLREQLARQADAGGAPVGSRPADRRDARSEADQGDGSTRLDRPVRTARGGGQ
jgi:hypothetical protein